MFNKDMFIGSVPEGEYHAIESSEQEIAIKYSKKIARELVFLHPEVADLYEQGLSYMEIAERVIPDTAKKYPKVAPKAVGYAVREIHDRKKQEQLTREHRKETLESALGDRMSEKNREVWKEAQAMRTAIHGAPTEALIRGRGQTPWSNDEKSMMQRLLQDDVYQSKFGTPKYASIAEQLNNLFHGGKHIRTEKSLGNYVRDLRRKLRKND